MKSRFISTLLFILIALPGWGHAFDRSQADAAFMTWLDQTVWPRASAQGVRRGVFEAEAGDLKADWELSGLSITRDNSEAQAEFRSPSDYFNAEDLKRAAAEGRVLANTYGRLLSRIERETGVPGRIILAVWWRETRYGQTPLRHDGIQVLATRAFSGPRKEFYTTELIAALKLLQDGIVTRRDFRSGSGGAIGQPQFMPSNIRRLGRDGDGDGRVSLTEPADSLASIGAFLAAAGWKHGADWGYEVTLPPAVSCTREAQDVARPFGDWARDGLRRPSGRDFPAQILKSPSYLLLPAGTKGPAFLVGGNFLALKRYNTSDLYGLLVGNLADRIAFGMGDFRGTWRKTPSFTRADVIAIQRALNDQGQDTGGVDGLAGYKTRRAIGVWQEKVGQPATCFPSRSIARALGG